MNAFYQDVYCHPVPVRDGGCQVVRARIAHAAATCPDGPTRQRHNEAPQRLMARCPQCGQEVANFANHRHDSVANYAPWSLLGFLWLGLTLRRQPEPMSLI